MAYFLHLFCQIPKETDFLSVFFDVEAFEDALFNLQDK